MAFPVFESRTSDTGSGTATPAIPTGTAEGDLLLAQVRATSHGAAELEEISASGYTFVSSQHTDGGIYLAYLWKVAGASESAVSFSFPTITPTTTARLSRISGGEFTSVGYIEKTSSSSDLAEFPAATCSKDALVLRSVELSLAATSFDTLPTGTQIYANTQVGLWSTNETAGAIAADSLAFTADKRSIGATIVIEDATATAYTITSIDGDNDVQAGQSNVSIVTSGIDPASVTQAVTLGGETLTINSWTDSGGNALINVDIPLHINAEWGTTHELAVTHDGGTTTLSGVTLSAPTGWETVSFATIPDTGTTESFYEYSQSDVTVGNFTAQVGDTLAFTSATGLTIDGSSIPVVNPAATVTGSYKWWDASLSTWTPVSSYTITNLGVFGGSDTTVMIQEMISDMISEMVN